MLGKLDAYEKSKTPLEFDGEELVMISAYGATPHKAEVSRVLGESKGAGVRAVKNLIAKNRAVEAFGASSSFKAPAAYLADAVVARVGPLLANIHSWDFDMWAVVDAVGDQRLAAKVLADEVLVKARDLAPGPYGAVVRTCVDAIVAGYEDVAYHNCLHGADCMQSLHATLAKSPKYEAALALDRADLESSTRLPCIRTAVDDDNDHTLLVVLLAALAHDVGHVGLTNAYLVETGHDFAVRYNDQSPLENYHVATALSIVEAKGFWDSFDAPGKRMGRLYWIECVLATDMAHHMAAMAQLDGLLRKEGAAGDAATPANHLAVVKAIVHACDISAPTKPVKTHLRWTDLVMEEFYAQAENGAGKECEIPNFKGSDLGHAEKELANGKAKPSVPPRGSVVLGKFQLGFIGFIRPLFAKIAAIPSVDFDAPLKNIDVVKNHWIAETEPKPADKLPAL
ncbi:calmodulin-dependent cyclic-nucleotide phosphodiesterase [Aureococcus anophagefferens]|uniref:Phosphodiesterase n=1 Tax=Aureococcus anophagefferens TaxID=44056 RepID=A0ABR1FV75_AURAN